MEELRQIDQRTRRLMPLQKILHPRDNTDRLTASRKGERRLTTIEDCVDSSIQLEEYITKYKTLVTYEQTEKQKKQKTTKKEKCREKQFYEHFKRQTVKITFEKT